MKPYLLIFAGVIFAAHLARAQVVINQAALDQLAGIPPAIITAPPEIRQPARKVIYRPVVHRHVAPPPASAMFASSQMIAPKPVTPPAVPRAQPAVAKPALPPAAAPPRADITFADGAADLPPGSALLLRPFCTKPVPVGPITIDAYAAADPSDLSAALRLSLSRAFALRDALAACGVPSASIIPRANGAAAKNPDVAVISAAP